MRFVSRFLAVLFAVILLLLGWMQSGTVLAATTPASDFTINDDGSTVTHKTTGLTWKRCVEGQTWTGSTCSGTAQRYTWYDAMAMGVNNGWGMPTKDQLSTITETGHATGDPAVNAVVFPNTPADWTWTALTGLNLAGLNYIAASISSLYNPGFGANDYTDPTARYYVRLVQSGKFLDPSATNSDFTINGDGSTVTHKTTGLTWKRCVEGKTWTGSTCSGTATRFNWNQAMALGGNGWGLPTKEQLLSLVEMNHAYPFINQTFFPNASTATWSASQNGSDPGRAWVVRYFDFLENFGDESKNYPMEVRLVQGGQSTGPLVLVTGLSITCPSTIKSWGIDACSGTASYSDGTSKKVTESLYGHLWWSTSNVKALNINLEGGLNAFGPTSDTTVTITLDYKENGVSKSATANVTVKAVGPLLTGLVANCPAIIVGGTSATCSATAGYSDGSSKVVNAVWHSQNLSTLAVETYTGTFTAGMPHVDTVVTIEANYTENNVFKSVYIPISVTPGNPVLTSLTAGCADTTIKSGASFSCNATAGHNNGWYDAVRPIWTSPDPSVLSVDSNGRATAGSPKFDTVVTLTASYSEGDVSKTATVTITVKAAPLVLTNLTVTCPNYPMNAGTSASCYATASYNDGSSKAVNPSWYTTNSTALSIGSNGNLTAGKPYSDTVVTISALYEENNVNKSVNATVTVKAAPAKLFYLKTTCPDALNAGASATCIATAGYDDGSDKQVNPTWTSSNPAVLSVDGNGRITAGTPKVDTVVTILANYTENNISESASVSVTVKAGNTVNRPPSTPTGFTAKNTGKGTGLLVWNASTDPDGDSIDYTLQSGADGKTWGYDKKISGTSNPLNTSGLAGKTIYFRVHAQDSKSKTSDWAMTTLTVTSDANAKNSPPNITNLSPLTVNGTTMSGFFDINDPDGDSVKNVKVHFSRNYNGSDCFWLDGDYNQPLSTGRKYFATGGSSCAGLLSSSGTIYYKVEAADVKGLSASVVYGSYVYTKPGKQLPPSVSSVVPTTARVGVLEKFTVTGSNLTSGMGFSIENCDSPNQEVPNTGSATSRTFQCTPRQAGSKSITVKPSPNGSAIWYSSVKITETVVVKPPAAPVISIDQPTAVAGTKITLSFAEIPNASRYELCFGTSSGNYGLGCKTIFPVSTLTMEEGWDYYVAVRAMNSGGEKSNYSNELHVISQILAPDDAWGSPSIGIDYDQETTLYNQPPSYSLSVDHLGVLNSGDIVRLTANATDADSPQLFYFWNATGGLLRPVDSQYQEVEWKAPQTPGTYFVTGSVGDGEGHVNGAYAILVVQ